MSDEEEGISSEEAFREDAREFIKQQQKESFLGMPEMAQLLTEIIVQVDKEGINEWKAQCVEALRKVAFEETPEYQNAKKDFDAKFARLLGDTMNDAKISQLDILLVIIERLNHEGFNIDPVY